MERLPIPEEIATPKATSRPSESWADPKAVFSLEIKKEEWVGEHELGKGATSRVLMADLNMSNTVPVPVAVKIPL